MASALHDVGRDMLLEVIEPPSKEVLETIRSEFGLNEQRVREAIEHLKNWIELQPHLPKEIDDGRLERWLIRCKNSMEKVKVTLDLYYTLRTNIPELMTGWDTKGDWFKRASSQVSITPMPQLTPNCDRVILYRFLSSNPTHYDPLNILKMNQMVIEIRMSEDYCRSDIYVFDLSKVSLVHISKVTFPLLKKYELCAMSTSTTYVFSNPHNIQTSFRKNIKPLVSGGSVFSVRVPIFDMPCNLRRMEDTSRCAVRTIDLIDNHKHNKSLTSGCNARIKALHFVNAPAYADTVIAMLRAVVKTKLIKRIHNHGSDLTSFYEEVPKEILPTEYGGNCGSAEEHWDRWKKKLEGYHDIFLEREKQKSDECKRPGKSITNSDLLGFEGSFRKLDVD